MGCHKIIDKVVQYFILQESSPLTLQNQGCSFQECVELLHLLEYTSGITCVACCIGYEFELHLDTGYSFSGFRNFVRYPSISQVNS